MPRYKIRFRDLETYDAALAIEASHLNATVAHRERRFLSVEIPSGTGSTLEARRFADDQLSLISREFDARIVEDYQYTLPDPFAEQPRQPRFSLRRRGRLTGPPVRVPSHGRRVRRARDVDPWSTLAMHPIELTAIVGIAPAMLPVAAVHAASLLAVCTFLGACIAFAHSGFELPSASDRALLDPQRSAVQRP